MRKLTDTQTAALLHIAANPGAVEATTRLDRTMLRINGNTEHKLHELGLIEAVDHHEIIRVVGGKDYPVMIRTWTLTDLASA